MNYLDYFKIPKYQAGTPEGGIRVVEQNPGAKTMFESMPEQAQKLSIYLSPVGNVVMLKDAATEGGKGIESAISNVRKGNYSGAAKDVGLTVAPNLGLGVLSLLPASGYIRKGLAGAKNLAGKVVDTTKSFLKRTPSGQVVEEVSIPTAQLSRRSKIFVDESGKLHELPEYAHPNTNPDLALELTQQRLENGGRERLKQSILEGTPEEITKWKDSNVIINGEKLSNNLAFYDESSAIREPIIISDSKSIGQAIGQSRTPNELGAAIPQNAYWVYTDAPKNLPGTSGMAHEFAHYYHTPLKGPEVDESFIELLEKIYGPDGKRYFKNLNGTEISARGTQLKNYFGLKEGQKITPEMWEYAKKNYVRDLGYDNNMTEFFNLITKEKLPAFLEWINKNAPVIAVPTLVGTTASGVTYKYQRGNKLRQIAPYLDIEKFNELFRPLKKKNE